MVVNRGTLANSGRMRKQATQKEPSEFSRALANRLRNLREESGLSQESVAHQAGISAYIYQKFEKGESKPGTPMNPRLFTLLSLAEVFGIDVRELLTIDEAEQRSIRN